VSGIHFRIQFADGRLEQLTVDSDRVVLGSGSHCEIRLPPEQASVEHVLITVHGNGIYAQARALNPPPTINGSPFTQAPLLPDSILGIGHVQIAVAIVAIEDVANVIKKQQKKTSPMTYVLAVIALPLALFILYDEGANDKAAAAPKEVPQLWPNASPPCPQKAPDLARNLAQDKKVMAEGKRERGPFHVQDAISAVPMFETAAACFKNAGDQGAATEMTNAAQKLRAQLMEDYRAHQMRLEHSLNVGDGRTAQREVRVLLGMLDGQSGAFVSWLQTADRMLALKLGKADAK
jgi:hypothetical protein